MGEIQVVGVSPEVMADPRVQAAIDDIQQKPEADASRVILAGLQGGVEKYGVKLRPISLTVVGPMLVQMAGFKLPDAQQMTAMLYVLGAPLREVYTALGAGEKDGWPAFMEKAAEWLAASGIPQDMSLDVQQAIVQTFEMANKLVGGGKGEGGEKKG
jgi:hypothetical protein